MSVDVLIDEGVVDESTAPLRNLRHNLRTEQDMRLTISRKLVLGFGFSLALLGVVGYKAWDLRHGI
jgi:hypothetical protein